LIKFKKGWLIMDIYILIYHLIEKIDGEKGIKLISYKLASKIKIICLLNMKG